MTDTKVFELVEALLKENEFTHISKTHSPHSATISAEKGLLRLVMHITDQTELPARALPNEKAPAATYIRLSATMDGLSPNGFGKVVQRGGQGGAVSKRGGALPKIERAKHR